MPVLRSAAAAACSAAAAAAAADSRCYFVDGRRVEDIRVFRDKVNFKFIIYIYLFIYL